MSTCLHPVSFFVLTTQLWKKQYYKTMLNKKENIEKKTGYIISTSSWYVQALLLIGKEADG